MIELNAHGASFKIMADSPADLEGWCKVQVQIQANGFAGDVIAWLEMEAIRFFDVEIKGMMDTLGQESSAWLRSSEPDLDIQLKMNRLGQVRGTYAIESERRDGIPTVLSGSFDIDQSFLSLLRRQLHDLIGQLKC